MKVFITYSDDRETVNDTYGEDGPYTGFHESRCDFIVRGVWLRKPENAYHDEFELTDNVQPGDTVHVVVVRYSDGSTFGRTTGLGHIIDAYGSREQAEEVRSSIRTKSYVGYTPWIGYFNRLEDVEIESFPLGKGLE